MSKNSQDRRMENVIVNYLKMETSYALLINGRRGIGKTFFIKDSIIPRIKKIGAFHDAGKMYKPVYISLYGLKSMDEVFTLMAIEFMPWLNSKGAKIGLSLGKLVTRGLLNINKAGDVDGYLKDLSGTAKQAIDTKDFVIIFDDLDRIAKSLEIGEVIGFINSLVEHENNKILVIADEEQLSGEAYRAVREKTIGTVVEYASTFSQNFDAIIESKYKATYGQYYALLLRYKDDILHWFAQTDTQNLRTLIYFLQHFHEIFSRLHQPLGLAQLEEGSLPDQKVKAVLQFSIATGIEFKKGAINYKLKNGLDDMRAIAELLQAAQQKDMFGYYQKSINDRSEQPLPKSYRDVFLETYFKQTTYDFYPSIFNFITGGDAFDQESLLAQLKKNFDDKVYTLSPQEDIHARLGNPQVLDLSNEAYGSLNDEMLAYALNGDYPLDKYLSVLHYLSRYPAIKSYDIPKTAEKLTKAVKRHKKKFAYADTLSRSFGIPQSRKDYQVYFDLFTVLNEVNNGINEARIKDLRADTLKEFIETPEVFYDNIEHLYDYNQSLLAYWNFDKFYQHFQQLKGSEIQRFNRFLRGRFGEVLIKDKLEYVFLEQLFDSVRKIDPEAPVTLRSGEVEQLGTLLHEILEKNMRFKNNP